MLNAYIRTEFHCFVPEIPISHRETFQALEASLVHVEVASLDIHQVMGLCWSQGLYDAIIHVHNCALMDYVTPLQELMPILQAALATGLFIKCYGLHSSNYLQMSLRL